MSTINVQNLLVQINRKLETAKNNKEILMLSKAVSVLQTGVVFTVGTFANLPDPTENIGKLYFVEADALLYFSFIAYNTTTAQWIPITNVSANVLWSWGNNDPGKLGDGTAICADRCSPGTTAGLGSNWCKISASVQVLTSFAVAIKTDGTIWTWGQNTSGQLGNNCGTNRNSPGTIVGSESNWCDISVTANSTAAIKTDGTLWTWGANCFGTLGNGTTVSRCSPGTTWGSYSTWCKVEGGNDIFAAIKCDGTLWTWGCNCFTLGGGMLGDGTTVDRCSPGTVAGGGTTWCKFSSFCHHSAAIKIDGTLWTWGSNLQGRLGDGTQTSRCSPGTVFGGGTNWCDVSLSDISSSAIKTDGTIWTWGCGKDGQLGNGTTVNRCSPGTIVGGGTTWCQVSGACLSVTALKTDGTIWTWGSNCCGTLGNGNATAVSTCSPGTIAGDGTAWHKICSGGIFILAITKETL